MNEVLEEYFNPKSGSIKFNRSGESFSFDPNFNPKSGSIKLRPLFKRI